MAHWGQSLTPLQVDTRYCCLCNSGNLSLLPPPHTKDLRPQYCLAWFNLTRQGEEQVFEIRQGRCLACYKAASGSSTRSQLCWSQETIDNILDALPDELILDPKRYYLNLAANDEGRDCHEYIRMGTCTRSTSTHASETYTRTRASTFSRMYSYPQTSTCTRDEYLYP
ncbi:hypothetical protein K488DRAFT_75438, partial [Vararia minispora EC-137]